MAVFAGFSFDSFDTYAPEKCSSNMHNLARMQVKDAILKLSDAAVDPDLQTQLTDLVRGNSDEIPNVRNGRKVTSQWVYWFRNPTACKSLASFLDKTILDQNQIFHIQAHEKHALLGVMMDHTHLRIGLWMAPQAIVDRQNTVMKLDRDWEREALLNHIQALPSGGQWGLEGGFEPLEGLDDAQLVAGLTRLSASNDAGWFIGCAQPRGDAVALGDDLVPLVRSWLQAVAPIYRQLAWAQDNDHIAAGKQIEVEKAKKRRSSDMATGDKVRITSGLFAGKTGVVADASSNNQVKVQVGKMAVMVSGKDLALVA